MSTKRVGELEKTLEEVEISVDEDYARTSGVKILEQYLAHSTSEFIKDWGSPPYTIGEEFSYDLGTIKGIQFAISLLEAALIGGPIGPPVH